ncbi:MAG: hypothetical protein WC216_10815 [Gallionella sp.]|jgi:hypothetical protein
MANSEMNLKRQTEARLSPGMAQHRTFESLLQAARALKYRDDFRGRL